MATKLSLKSAKTSESTSAPAQSTRYSTHSKRKAVLMVNGTWITKGQEKHTDLQAMDKMF